MKRCAAPKPKGMILRPCQHQVDDKRVERLVKAARAYKVAAAGMFRYSQTLEAPCRELDDALKALDGEYESPEGQKVKAP